MSLLVRKINRAKWPKDDIEDNPEVSADAITHCLRTISNTLSVWQINNEHDLEKAVLAIVTTLDHLETIDIVILEAKYLNDYNIGIVATPGETPIEDLAEIHRDLAELTYSKLGTLKNHIVERIRANFFKRYTRTKVKKFIQTAIEEGKLELKDLKESVREKI